MEMEAPYYISLAAAFVRGKLSLAPDAASPSDDELIQLGLRAGLRLHKFKRTMELRRVRCILGALRGLAPTSLLDIGSGRGTFLWLLLDALRAQLIDLFAAYGARIRIVYVEAPYAELVRRNRARVRPVPEAVIERLDQRLAVPDLTEAHAVDLVET
jgi:hypothetical protein